MRHAYQAVELAAELGGDDLLTYSAYDAAGRAAVKLGKHDEAQGYLRRSLKIVASKPVVYLVIRVLASIGEMLVAEGRLIEAVELLTYARDHRLQWAHERRRSSRILEDLQAQLPVEVFNAAVSRGQALDFDAVVQQHLEEGIQL